MSEPNNDEVICPNCAHQFRAIPVNVQLLMLDVGFEPPFMEAPPLAKLQARFTPPAPAPQQAQDQRCNEVFEALGLDPDRYITEGGAINVPKLRATIKHPSEYLPPDHWMNSPR